MKISGTLWKGASPLLSLALTGCLSATAPILTDAQAILGEQIEVHAFSPKGTGNPHTVVTYQWNGSRYLPRDQSPEFANSPFTPEGRDRSQQIRAASELRLTELRRASVGRARSPSAISEDDAEEAMRERFCNPDAGRFRPHPPTPEQLFVRSDRGQGRRQRRHSGHRADRPTLGHRGPESEPLVSARDQASGG